MNAENLQLARARIADCLQMQGGQLVQRRDSLNLAGLGLTDAELKVPFDPGERGLPEICLADLRYLRYLDLTSNQLTRLPEGVDGMTKMLWLGLNFNQVVSLGGIGSLGQLERLYLRDNQLKTLPEEIGNLKSLIELDLHGNRLHRLPGTFLNLLTEVRSNGWLTVDLDDNGSQLSEIANAAEMGEARVRALRHYLQELGEGADVLAQGKLLLVGEGGVGKTTLLDVMEGKAYNPNSDTTHGLELRRLPFAADEGWDGVLHAWDFSGQPAMRQTHQLFFTTPALYLLVWNHREARETETSVEIMEWLTLIDQRTQGEGRVLLVAKKCQDRDAEPPHYSEILRRFGSEAKDGRGGVLLPDPCLKVDSESEKDTAVKQVMALKARIARFAHDTKSFNEERPKSWIKAQQHFQSRRSEEPYLEWKDFAPKCIEFGITEPQEYARVQHRLGTLVWLDTERMRHVDLVHGEEEPEHIVVLNPDWLSKAIGYVIEYDDSSQHPEAGGATGLVAAEQMDAVWISPPKSKHSERLEFPCELFDFFRQLMRAFDIARPVKHEDSDKRAWYLIPNRLQDSPSEAWTTSWRDDLPQVYWRVELRVEGGEPLNHWLGLAVFYRLMIILHGDAQGRQDFSKAAHWRRGFILEPHSGSMARIEYNGSDRRDASRCVGFDIHAASHQPRELWSLFAESLDHLVHDLERNYGYASIDVKRLVSCPTSLCDREASKRCYIDESVVARRAHSGNNDLWKEETTICNARECGQDLPMGLLWDGRATEGTESTTQLDRMEGYLVSIKKDTAAIKEDVRSLADIEADLRDVHVRLDANALADEASVAAILSGQSKLSRDLKGDMERLQAEIMVKLRHFHEDLAVGLHDLPRFYSLMPKPGFNWPFKRRQWRLWLHCEKTGYPAPLMRNDSQGEFFLPESSELLKTVAPYLKSFSKILVALSPVTAVLSVTNPILIVGSGTLLAMAKWAKDYGDAIEDLSDLVEEETSDQSNAIGATGHRATNAEDESLLWLHSFLNEDQSRLASLGLLPKRDGQGRVWWVLPEVEV